MTKWRPVLIAIALLLVGTVYVRACWEPSIRADERARAGDARTDSVVARLQGEARDSFLAFTRERDSTGRVIRRLQQRIAGGRQATVAIPIGAVGDTAKAGADRDASAPLLLRDSLIAALEAGRAQDSLQLVFWRSAVAQRDSIIPRLQQARDSWRQSAQRPRHTLTDIAGGVALGYGLARENEVAALAGGALILVPRVVDVLGRIL